MNAFKTIASAALIAAALGVVSAAAEAPIPATKASAAAATQSRDGYDRRVRIYNRTGWTMTHFYASDSRISDWEEDMLGSSVLDPGESIVMNIDDGSGACLYDFKARFTNGQELSRFRVNVCEISSYSYTR